MRILCGRGRFCLCFSPRRRRTRICKRLLHLALCFCSPVLSLLGSLLCSQCPFLCFLALALAGRELLLETCDLILQLIVVLFCGLQLLHQLLHPGVTFFLGLVSDRVFMFLALILRLACSFASGGLLLLATSSFGLFLSLAAGCRRLSELPLGFRQCLRQFFELSLGLRQLLLQQLAFLLALHQLRFRGRILVRACDLNGGSSLTGASGLALLAQFRAQLLHGFLQCSNALLGLLSEFVGLAGIDFGDLHLLL
mmetsp:Transcript_130488/g.278806  ORF Transcript_130488/g.278806 Transcript_130488/m.278806 type:complete len:253 (+) Transcript_130488:1682-2440(+)